MKKTAPFIFQQAEEGITIVGEITEKGFVIGTSKCGKNQAFDAELGVSIAMDRLKKQPQAIVAIENTPKTAKTLENYFNFYALLQANTMQRAKQWSPRLPRVDKPDNTKTALGATTVVTV